MYIQLLCNQILLHYCIHNTFHKYLHHQIDIHHLHLHIMNQSLYFLNLLVIHILHLHLQDINNLLTHQFHPIINLLLQIMLIKLQFHSHLIQSFFNHNLHIHIYLHHNPFINLLLQSLFLLILQDYHLFLLFLIHLHKNNHNNTNHHFRHNLILLLIHFQFNLFHNSHMFQDLMNHKLNQIKKELL